MHVYYERDNNHHAHLCSGCFSHTGKWFVTHDRNSSSGIICITDFCSFRVCLTSLGLPLSEQMEIMTSTCFDSLMSPPCFRCRLVTLRINSANIFVREKKILYKSIKTVFSNLCVCVNTLKSFMLTNWQMLHVAQLTSCGCKHNRKKKEGPAETPAGVDIYFPVSFFFTSVTCK